MIYNNIYETIGKTPVIKLKTDENSADIYAKLEFFNPGGSVKDRVAYQMIMSLKEAGKINSDTVMVEPTSGNTGIGIAMICSALGIKCKIVIPETMSAERMKIMSAYGAELVLTEGSKGMPGAIAKATELTETENHIMLAQFDNFDNVIAHKLTTAKEICEDFADIKLDAFVAGIGTGGTVTGNGVVLKEKFPEIKIVGVEPFSSPFLSKGQKGPHKIQGIGAGFKPQILDLDILDEIITVTNEDAKDYARKFSENGILIGFSGGANYRAALKMAEKLGKGKNVLFIVPDNGERYLSTDLYGE